MARWRIGIENVPHPVRDVSRRFDQVMGTLRDKMAALLDDLIHHRRLRHGVRRLRDRRWPGYSARRVHWNAKSPANRQVVGI